jgi:hypothetical protein
MRLVSLLTLAFLAAGVTTAEARPRPAGHHHRSNFEANKTFGLGIMLGAPTGLSGKYFVSKDTAIDFGLGTIYGYRDRHAFHLHADFLWHPLSLVSAPAFELPLYLGIGGRFLDGDRCYHYDRDGFCDLASNDYSAIGVRAPIGISFDLNNAPLDIFVEIAFVLDFVVSHPDGEGDLFFDIDGAIGIRYYFN